MPSVGAYVDADGRIVVIVTSAQGDTAIFSEEDAAAVRDEITAELGRVRELRARAGKETLS